MLEDLVAADLITQPKVDLLSLPTPLTRSKSLVGGEARGVLVVIFALAFVGAFLDDVDLALGVAGVLPESVLLAPKGGRGILQGGWVILEDLDRVREVPLLLLRDDGFRLVGLLEVDDDFVVEGLLTGRVLVQPHPRVHLVQPLARLSSILLRLPSFQFGGSRPVPSFDLAFGHWRLLLAFVLQELYHVPNLAHLRLTPFVVKLGDAIVHEARLKQLPFLQIFDLEVLVGRVLVRIHSIVHNGLTREPPFMHRDLVLVHIVHHLKLAQLHLLTRIGSLRLVAVVVEVSISFLRGPPRVHHRVVAPESVLKQPSHNHLPAALRRIFMGRGRESLQRLGSRSIRKIVSFVLEHGAGHVIEVQLELLLLFFLGLLHLIPLVEEELPLQSFHLGLRLLLNLRQLLLQLL